DVREQLLLDPDLVGPAQAVVRVDRTLHEEARVGAPDVRPRRRLVEQLDREGLDGPQHRETRARAAVVGSNQALVDQRRESAQDIQLAGRIAYGLHGLECEAAGEDRQPREQLLLVLAQELVAPQDRAAQRLVALRRVEAAATHELEPVAQAGEQLLRRKQLHACR